MIHETEEAIPLCKKDETIQHAEVFCYASQGMDGHIEELDALQKNPSCVASSTLIKPLDSACLSEETHSSHITSYEVPTQDTPKNNEEITDTAETSVKEEYCGYDTYKHTVSDGTKDEIKPVLEDNSVPPKRKRIAYSQIVKEGRRFNIDLVSKVSKSFTHLIMKQY